MEWASLCAFYLRGVQGIWEFHFESNYSENSSVLTLTTQPPAQYNQIFLSILELVSPTYLMTLVIYDFFTGRKTYQL